MHPPQLITGYTTYGMVPPNSACFSPQFSGQAGHMFPFSVVSPQWTYPAAMVPPYGPAGQFLLPQVVPRPSAPIPPVPGLRLSSTTAAPPIYGQPPLYGAAIYVQQPRPFLHNADQLCHTAQNVHYSMESMTGTASFTGTAIIQEDVSATLPRMNAQLRTNAGDDYQQQTISSESAAGETMNSYSRPDSITSPNPNHLDEDDKRQSCESPTIVIQADQNAAAIASRQRASALMMNASSTPVIDTAASSSAPPPATKVSTTTDVAAAPPSVPSHDATAANSHSPTQSPQLPENADPSALGNAQSSSLPVREADVSGADIYYDAEDKPAQEGNPPTNGAAMDNSANSTVEGATSAPSDEMATATRAATNAPAGETEEASTTATLAANTKSWASLFRNTPSAHSAIVVKALDSDTDYRKTDGEPVKQRNRATPADISISQLGDVVSVDGDASASKLAGKAQLPILYSSHNDIAISFSEIFRNIEFMNRGPTFLLRGIVNRGNWCYVNASLQALMACPPFYHFLRNLSPLVQREHTSTPLLDAL